MQHQPFCPSSSFTSSNIITLSHLFLLSINHAFSWREAGIRSDNDTPCTPSLNIKPCSSSQFYMIQNNSRHTDGFQRSTQEVLPREYIQQIFTTSETQSINHQLRCLKRKYFRLDNPFMNNEGFGFVSPFVI